MQVIKFFDESPITFNDGGFFNATQAAAVFGKLPAEWARLPSTVEYIAELEKSDVGLSRIALIVTKKAGRVV